MQRPEFKVWLQKDKDVDEGMKVYIFIKDPDVVLLCGTLRKDPLPVDIELLALCGISQYMIDIMKVADDIPAKVEELCKRLGIAGPSEEVSANVED